MVTPSRLSASFYCYVQSLKLFIIVSNNAVYIKIQEIVVSLFYDKISKYDNITSTHMVAIGFLILHGEYNLALQMASTEKLETRAVIKCSQQQGDTSPKTLKEMQLRTRSMQWAAQYISIGIHVLEKDPQASTTSKEEGERRKLHRR